jgi:hypothetical protein
LANEPAANAVYYAALLNPADEIWNPYGPNAKARLIPTVIALMPLFCTVYYFFPGLLDKTTSVGRFQPALLCCGVLGFDVFQGPGSTLRQAILE